MEYNEQQKKAIHAIQGPVIVISCAGSGKTSVILERTNNIIKSGVSASHILVVTFSKAAAKDMEERFAADYGNGGVKFATIHSVCYSILANAYGLNPTSILKAGEKFSFLREEYIELKKKFGRKFDEQYRDLDEFYKDMSLKISGFMLLMYKDKQYDYDCVIEDPFVKYVYCAYMEFKKAAGKIDYDDMIIESHKCLRAEPEILEYWRSVFQYIMIDEYQDTNLLQAEIFFMLAGDKRNICVVGDDDQSIYGFRHADYLIFHKFLAEYPDAARIILEMNYRSLPQIIQSAARLISHNEMRFHKKFKTFRSGTAKISQIEVDGNMEQTYKILAIIRNYQDRGVPLQEIAVLYRVKKKAALLCNRLYAEKIPFYTKELPEDLHTGMVFQDIKAYYRLANDLWGNMDLQRIINRPSRYIKASVVVECNLDEDEIIKKCTEGVRDGERREHVHRVIQRLFVDLKNLRNKKPLEFMDYLDKQMKYRDALTRYADFLNIDQKTFTDEFDELRIEAEKFDTMSQWSEYAAESRKEMIRQMEKNRKEGVYLTTFHSAKGLEWNNVIIIAANDGVTPLVRGDDIENPEEERRLFYVAMTRAKEELSITYFKGDDTKGNQQKTLPSRYLSEMQEHMPDEADADKRKRTEKNSKKSKSTGRKNKMQKCK